MMRMEIFRRARIAGEAISDIANWRDVLPRAARGQAVTEIRLRNGASITAPPEVGLWPHFSDIWYHKSYTKHCSMPRDSVVVDVGANVGVFSLFAARSARIVYSLEPATSNFSRLASNVSGSQNIVPLNLACAGRDGRASLDLSSDPVSFSLMTNACSDKQEIVEIVSLETLFERYKITRCDFLKLDCEGSEFEIILNCEPMVMGRVSRVVLEYHDHLSARFSHLDLVQRLESLGFQAISYNSRGTYGMIAAVRA